MLRNRQLMIHHLMNSATAEPKATTKPPLEEVVHVSQPEPVVEPVLLDEKSPEENKEPLDLMEEPQEIAAFVADVQLEDVPVYRTEETKKRPVGVKSKIA
jgi:hypothetical protein